MRAIAHRASLTAAERRSARLIFSERLGTPAPPEARLAGSTLRRAVRPPRRVVGRGALERLAVKRGLRTYERTCLAPVLAARDELLGDQAPGLPRLLVRVDEFPHAQALDTPRFANEAFVRFDEIMRSHGIDYLVSVNPRLSHHYLDPNEQAGRELDEHELARVGELSRRGVQIALHHYDHRTRHPRPRHHSALRGLSASQLGELLDRAQEVLEAVGVRPRVFVPPFNRFDLRHWEVLARRFDVICAGPETVVIDGLWPTPCWRGEAVYLPSYAPLYGTSAEILAGVRGLLERRAAVWAPVTLHWGWELRRPADLERLVEKIAPYCCGWGEFLGAVQESREPPAPAAVSSSSTRSATTGAA
ncbi:MAG TPA: DUF2334 domain-containing protein [Solirubrobacteraceae bacterium]|jgi:peptidoglycan/xylan/chitin deacetylase (PgdA/CDA1 family)|nr:DUF2334 domain-containing protein [Solirubrobacteraceae bacterium]